MTPEMLERNGRLMPAPEETLTQKQANLLSHFRANAGKILSREELYAAVWRMTYYPKSRTLDQTVSVVRKHLSAHERIITVARRGYRYEGSSEVSSCHLTRSAPVTQRTTASGTEAALHGFDS